MKNCSIDKADSEALVDKIKKIGRFVKKSENKQNTFAQEINKLGHEYFNEDGDLDPEDIEYLSVLIKDTINRFFSRSIVKEISFSALDSYLTASTKSLSELVNQIDADENKSERAVSLLSKMFGANEDVRSYTEIVVSNSLVNSTLINRDSGYEIEDDVQLNHELQEYQQSLFDKVVNYIKENGNLSSDELLKVSSYNVFNDLSKLNEYVDKILPLSSLGYHYGNSTISSNKFVDAYISWVILNNFDNYLLSKEGSFIGIKTNLIGTLSDDSEKYYFKGVGSRLRAGWESDSEKDKKGAVDETSEIVKQLANTMEAYKWGSKSPVKGRVFDLSGLLYITHKIKSLIFEPTIKNIKFSPVFFSSEGYPEFSKYENDLQGKTFYDLLGLLDTNNFKYYPIIVDLLSNKTFFNSNSSIFKRVFRSDDLDLLQALSENIFNTNNSRSFLSIHLKHPNSKNYYSYIVKQMSDVDNSIYLESKYLEDGSLVQSDLKDAMSNTTKSALERIINGFNSKINPTRYSDLNDKYHLNFEEGIFKFDINGLEVTFNPKTKETSIIFNGTQYSEGNADAGGKELWKVINPFVTDILNLSANDIIFFNALNEEFSLAGAIQYKDLFSLFTMASSNLFNIYFSNVLAKGKNEVTQFNNVVKDVFADRKSKVYVRSAGSGEIEINSISKDDINSLKRLAIAKDISTGKYASGLVKDANGNAIAAIVTRRLAGNVLQQYRQIGYRQNSSIKGFSLLNNTNLFKGVGYLRDFTDGYTTQSGLKFNPSEFFDNSFLINYLGIKYKYTENSNNRYTAIFPDAISDKPQILNVLLNINTVVNGKVIKDFSGSDFKNLAKRELGNYYLKAFTNILYDFKLLSDFAQSQGLPEINPLTNFSEWNAKFGSASVDMLHDLIYQYNETGNIKLIDQAHYFSSKGDNGLLRANRGWLIELNKNDSNLDFESAFKQMYPGIDVGDFFKLQTEKAKELLKTGNYGTNNKTFWDKQEARLVLDLMREGYKLDLTDAKGNIKPSNCFHELYNYSNKDWTNTQLGRMILAKIRFNDTSKGVIEISSEADFKNITYLNSEGKVINYKSSDFDLREWLSLNDATLEIHPELEAFNSMQYLFGEEYIISTVGNHYNHDGKKSVNKSADLEDAYRFAAARKRAVSQTATIHSFARNLPNGIQNQYRVATVGDIEAPAFNMFGMEQPVKAFDGATFVEPSQVYLENNSLKGDVAGVDKKTFAHFYDARTGTGGIIKTACFGITNARIRNSADLPYAEGLQFYKFMAKRMMDLPWNVGGVPYKADITKDYNGNSIKYKTIFFKGNSDFFGNVPFEKGAYYQIVGDIVKLNADNSYQLTVAKVDVDGSYSDLDDNGNPKTITVIKNNVDTNYKVWQMFGGEFSHELDKNGKLVPSETSIQNLVTAEINVGYKLPSYIEGTMITASDLVQPLKNSSIQYVVTAGAIKQGGSNINSAKAFYNSSYKMNTFTIDTHNIGIQLNTEHHADNATLSLMTQVVNALSSRNYKTEEAEEVYAVLKSITEYAISDFTDELGRVLDRNDEKFKNSLVQIIIDSMKNSPSREGNLLATIAEDLIAEANKGRKITFDQVNGGLAFSIPAVYKKVTSILSSAFTSKGIKFKFAGILAVLNPSYSIYKLYGDRLRGTFDSYEDILDLQKTVYDLASINKINKLLIGHRYKAIPVDAYNSGITEGDIIDLTETTNDLSAPRRYWEAKQKYSKGYVFIEDITQGRDLGSYNFTFESTTGESFNAFDLSVIQAIYNYSEAELYMKQLENARNSKNNKLASGIFDVAIEDEIINTNIQKLKDFCTKYDIPLPETVYKFNKKYLQRILQQQLFAVSTGETDIASISEINDKGELVSRKVKVNKNTLEVIPYEVIMPKIYAEKFGLLAGDDVNTIRLNKDFFLERLVKNWKTIDKQNYHLSLKRLDGNHVYLMKRNFANTSKMKKISIDTYYEGDKLYRIDKAGNKLYRLASTNDEVYEADGAEVIVTDNIDFYLDSFSYNTIQFSDIAVNSEYFDDLFSSILNSDSTNVEKFMELLGDTTDYKEAVNQLNEVYENELKNATNPNAELTNPILLKIRKLGREIHTSFIQSLDVLASRIPAQSMQSFMAMRVAGFDESDLNSAYVSHFQFWLQGSDLDIDKVSLLGYEFTNDGKFIGWSPYFNMETPGLLKASKKLPFPTGRKVEVVETEDPELLNSTQDLFSRYIGKYGLNRSISAIEKENVKATVIGYLADFLQAINKNGGKLYVKPGTKTEALEKLINRHNMYINKFFREQMSKNFVSTYMFNISADPISCIQSQSPIGEPVKILKNKGDSSIVEAYDKYDTAGNYMAIVKGFRNNQIGKECVYISESEINTIGNIIHYYGNSLRNTISIKQLDLLSNNVICGHTLNMIANTYTTPKQMHKFLHKSINSEGTGLSQELFKNLCDALQNVDQDSDILLAISAIINAAWNNAKSPILSKINGGPRMLPLYIYGILMGIPFEDLSNCMMSDTARLINNLLDGNVIQNIHGFENISSVIDYLEKGPIDSTIPPNMKYLIISIFKQQTNRYDETIDIGKSILNNYADDNSIINIRKLNITFSELRAKAELIPGMQMVELNRAIERLQLWVERHNLAVSESIVNINNELFKILPSFKSLSYGANELRRVQSLYSLNKQLDIDTYEIIDFINNFNSIFADRKKELTTEQLNSKVTYYLNDRIFCSTMRDVFDTFKDSDYLISFDKFMDDINYRNDVIAKYGAIKHSINILDVIVSNPHYLGFLEATRVNLNAIRSSVKFRMLEKYYRKVLKNNSYGEDECQKMTKKITTFFDIVLNNKWLRSRNITFTIPARISITKTIRSQDGDVFTLGTEIGNAAFKTYMESVVIPNLKKGIIEGIGGRDYLLRTNKFIESLQSIKLDRTESGNPSYAYVSEVNAMPRNTYEKYTFQKTKNALDKLFTNRHLKYNGFVIGDLLFYYNTIVFNNALGQSTLTSFFENLFGNKSSEVINSWIDFTYNIDINSDLEEGVDFEYDDLLRFTARKTKLNNASGLYVRVKNFRTLGWYLYKRKDIENRSNMDSSTLYKIEKLKLIEEESCNNYRCGRRADKYILIDEKTLNIPWLVPQYTVTV